MLSVTVQNVGNVTLYRCAGRIIADDGDALRDAVFSQLQNRTVVLDLAEISAVDAAGLGILVSLRGWAHATGRGLKLLNLPPRVEEVLKLTKLMSAFEVCSVRDMMDLLCRLNDEHPRAAGEEELAYLVAPPAAATCKAVLTNPDNS